MEVLVFLHGFLGRPSDWQDVAALAGPHQKIIIPDYMNIEGIGPDQGFENWGAQFNRWLVSELNRQSLDIKLCQIHLIGYSLGGRLALHAFSAQPNRYQRLSLISTNPGFSADQTTARQLRHTSDAAWADKFLNEPWHEVLEKWNAQDVFVGSRREPVRLETEYNKNSLAASLVNWSLANQKNFIEVLAPMETSVLTKIVLINGSLDKKYLEISNKIIKSLPAIQGHVIQDSGHRVPYDQPVGLWSSLQK